MLSWLLQCCPSAPVTGPVLSCSFLHHPCPGAQFRAALSHSLSICGYMCCPFPNHTFMLRLLLPFFFPDFSSPFSPSDVFLCPHAAWACQAAFPSIPGGLSPHCQLLQFQTQLFSSVLRQMESLITFYRLGRVQNAIDSPCLSFTAAGLRGPWWCIHRRPPRAQHCPAASKPWAQTPSGNSRPPTSVSELTPSQESQGQRSCPEVVGRTFSDGQHCLVVMS